MYICPYVPNSKKYSAEFRSKVEMENINQGKSYTSLGEKYSISKNKLETWVRRYKKQGHLIENMICTSFVIMFV